MTKRFEVEEIFNFAGEEQEKFFFVDEKEKEEEEEDKDRGGKADA
jgi:hypothetical protein